MITKSVAVSAAVGKQVYPITGEPVILKGYSMYGPISAATIVIRDGNASGDIVHESSAVLDTSPEFRFPGNIRFDKGMHVKVLGVGSSAYLYID